jgi:hypothetical protein
LRWKAPVASLTGLFDPCAPPQQMCLLLWHHRALPTLRIKPIFRVLDSFAITRFFAARASSWYDWRDVE